MPSRNVQATSIVKSFTDAHRAFTAASKTAQHAGSVKLCNNTYLIRESNGDTLISYALAFHGSKIIRYFADGRIQLNSCGYMSATTKHRMNQFTPFSISQRSGVWYISKRNPDFTFVSYKDRAAGEPANNAPYWLADGEFVDGIILSL